MPPFRYYVSNQGRWLTPDPLAGSIFNPQSLNRYAYALNNPTSLTDPLGLCTYSGSPAEMIACEAQMQQNLQQAGQLKGEAGTAMDNSLWKIGALPGEPGQGHAGNNIIDAWTGSPGTFISFDAMGNVTFGFDITLCYETMSSIDAIRSGTIGSLPGLAGLRGWVPSPGSLAPTGFVEIRTSVGTYIGAPTEISGNWLSISLS